MEGKYLPEEQWERMFRNKREMDRLMHERAEYEIMMQREPSPYLASNPGVEGNRAERRKQAAQARKSKP